MGKRGRINPKSNDEAAIVLAEADKLYSQYVRLRDADEDGNVACYTCGAKMFWEGDGAQLGHYLNRSNLRVRFHKYNTAVQCSRCNEQLGGNIKEFGKRLKKENTSKFFKMIKLSKITDRYWTIPKLLKLIKKLSHKISKYRSQKML